MNTRPSGLRIFLDNFYWTWRHRKFQYKSAVICAFVGIILSIQVIRSGQESDFVGLLGAGLAIIGLIALFLDHREIKAEAKEFTVAPLTDETHKHVLNLAKSYQMDSDLFENRTFLFPVEANRSIRAGMLHDKEIKLDTRPFEIPKTEFCRRAFEHFRRKAGVVWNDKKIRLNSDPRHFATMTNGIQLQLTSYFDYLATGFYSQRSWKFQNKVEYDGLQFMHDGTCLMPLARSRTAHHIGVTTILLTSNKRLLVQQTQAKGSIGRYVPSGSGSLDLGDLVDNSFGKSLLNGALREFREETGWDELASRKSNMQKTDAMDHYPLGMVLDVSRGLVTDFHFLSVASSDTHLEYDQCYSSGKVIVDAFEISTQNAITWLDCSECMSFDDWKEKLASFVSRYKSADPILAINLKLFGELLADIESQPKHKLIPILLGNPNRIYTEAQPVQ